jgi:hypothetical protein
MLPLILLAASLLPSEQATTTCVDTGASTATAQTQPVRGPAGVTAVLKVSTADDHSKNSHECEAEYQLLVTPASGGTPMVVDIDTVDYDWGRSLSFRLDGFSQDGKHVFGIISEGGKYPITLLFDYDTTSRGAPPQLIDLKMQFAGIVPAMCISTFGVIGTTETGAIVLELNSAKPCGAARRWLIKSTNSKPRPLPHDAAMESLYQLKTSMQ